MKFLVLKIGWGFKNKNSKILFLNKQLQHSRKENGEASVNKIGPKVCTIDTPAHLSLQNLV